jgi:threonine/homoserine/homoserine lactone efflux protein
VEFFTLFILGVAFGLGAAVPIGPINTEIARRTLRDGMLAGICFGFGAVAIDIIYASAASLGIGVHLQKNRTFEIIVTLVGFLLLLTLGVLTLRGAYKAWRSRRTGVADGLSLEAPPAAGGALDYQPRMPQIAQKYTGTSLPRSFITGFLMTGLNPYTWAFWFVALPAAFSKQIEQASRDLPALLLGVLVGTGGWVVAFSGLLGWLRRYSREGWIILADVVGGLTLLGFAVVALLALGR